MDTVECMLGKEGRNNTGDFFVLPGAALGEGGLKPATLANAMGDFSGPGGRLGKEGVTEMLPSRALCMLLLGMRTSSMVRARGPFGCTTGLHARQRRSAR